MAPTLIFVTLVLLASAAVAAGIMFTGRSGSPVETAAAGTEPTTSVPAVSTTGGVVTASDAECAAVAQTRLAGIDTWVGQLTERDIIARRLPPFTFGDRACAGEVADGVRARMQTATGVARIGYAAYLSNPDDPSGLIDTLVAAYPHTVADPVPDDPIPIPSWIVVLESVPRSSPVSEAERRQAGYLPIFDNVWVISSDEYVSLRPGYWAVVAWGFDSFDAALDACRGAGLSSAACYPRLLQALGDQSTVLDGCGLYGRFTVLADVPVYLHPRQSQAEVRGTFGQATFLNAAGPEYRAGGQLWRPIVGDFLDGNRMAWVRYEPLIADSQCEGMPTFPVTDSCQAVVDDAVVSLASTGQDRYQAEVAAHRAVRLRCDPSLVNQQIRRELQTMTVDDPLERLRLEIWALIPLVQS